MGPVTSPTSIPIVDRFECSVSLKPDRLPVPQSFLATINAEAPTVNVEVTTSALTTQRLVVLTDGRGTLTLSPGPDGRAPSLKVYELGDDGPGDLGCQYP